MQIVLEDGDHTFDASAKEITLAAPYTSLSLGQILSIKDLTTNDVLYDVELQRSGSISIAGAVITHTHGNIGQADGDILQVTIDVGGTTTPIYVSVGTGSSAVGDGRQTVTTPGTAVGVGGDVPIKEITITAELDNTDVVCAGGSTVVAAEATRRGTPLYAGDSTTIGADNLNEVFLDSVVAGEGVSYTYLS